MPLENREINRFKKRIKRFSKLFPKYKKFVKLLDFIQSLLTPEQKQILEFKYKEIVIDFKTQLLFYFEDKYDSSLSLPELKEKAEKALKKYFFLFETNWDYSQIRTTLLRELMEVISIGSQCFYHRRKKIIENSLFGEILEATLVLKKIRHNIVLKYPNLPLIKEQIKRKKIILNFSETFFSERYQIIFSKRENEELWISEFFKRTKWFFEQLNSCEEEYRNKYREKIYQETCLALGIEKNYLHLSLENYIHNTNIIFSNVNIDVNPNIYLPEISEEIISYFEESELEKFKKIDSQGEEWSFKEQLLDRYYSRYPSFVPLEDLKKQIKEKVEKYKPLLLFKNYSEITKEIFLDELEQELFVTKNTNSLNQKMFNYLEPLKRKEISRNVIWAINQIIEFIGSINIENLSLEINLKSQLLLRWKNTLLITGKRNFKRKLIISFVKTGLEKEITKTKLQAFLKEIDSCFIYTKKNRFVRILSGKDGTGDISKLRKNLWIEMAGISKIIAPIKVMTLFTVVIIIVGLIKKN